jgi:hypothetical protein
MAATERRFANLITESTPLLAYIYHFLPTKEASIPASITLNVAILFSRPIKSARWNPQRPRRLAVCTYDPSATSLPALGGMKRGTHVGDVVEIVGSGVYIWDGDWENEADSSIVGEGDADGPTETEGVVEGIAVPHRESIRLVMQDLDAQRQTPYTATFSTLDVRWSPDGQSLSVLDKPQFCVLYDAQVEELAEEELLMDEYEPAMLETLQEESYMSEYSRRVSIRQTPSRVEEVVPQDLEDILQREHDTLHRRRS